MTTAHKFDVFSLSETWLKNFVPEEVFVPLELKGAKLPLCKVAV